MRELNTLLSPDNQNQTAAENFQLKVDALTRLCDFKLDPTSDESEGNDFMTKLAQSARSMNPSDQPLSHYLTVRMSNAEHTAVLVYGAIVACISDTSRTRFTLLENLLMALLRETNLGSLAQKLLCIVFQVYFSLRMQQARDAHMCSQDLDVEIQDFLDNSKPTSQAGTFVEEVTMRRLIFMRKQHIAASQTGELVRT